VALAVVRVTNPITVPSYLVDCDISHTNGAFLLIGPRMPLGTAIEGFVAIGRLDLVPLFQAADEEGHSTSYSPDKNLRRVGGSP